MKFSEQVSLTRTLFIKSSQRSIYWWIFALPLAMVFTWLLGRSAVAPQAVDIPPFIVDSAVCQTASSENKDEFLALVTDPAIASPLLELLCATESINKQYGQVKVVWNQNEAEVIEFIGKGIVDMALAKEGLMNAFDARQTHGYLAIAYYQNYASYLISMKEKPLISKQYLWGKRLGLLDYPSSRSGHTVPTRMLKRLNMSKEDVQIRYADSHQTLRNMLASGEVDLIASYWDVSDQQKFSSNYITPIEQQISGGKWFLKMETNNTDLLCQLQHTLSLLSQRMASDYYRQLTLEPLCES